MSLYTRGYQCVNDCNVFWTVGIPKYCPHCGVPNVLPVDEDVTLYETVDEVIENTHDG